MDGLNMTDTELQAQKRTLKNVLSCLYGGGGGN